MQQKDSSPIKLLSVVVPAYKQEKTIVEDINNIQDVLKRLPCQYEIIVVVDGHTDTTYEKIANSRSSKVKVMAYEKNQGKGHAVRFGMMHAKGDIIGFVDAGMDINPKGMVTLLEIFQKNHADIVIGSKRHPHSKVSYPFQRRVISYLSQKFIKLLFGLDLTDTQVGMKFFRRAVVKKVLPYLLVKNFAFDVEFLSVAYYFGFTRIYESPVELKYNFEGSVLSQNMISALYKTLWDTCAVFYRLKIIHYYDKKKALDAKTRPDFTISAK